MHQIPAQHLQAFVCPTCHRALHINKNSLSCENCDKQYLFVDGYMPTLFQKPYQALFKAALSLKDSEEKFQARKDKAQELVDKGIRTKAAMSVIKADSHSIALIKKLKQKLINAGLREDMLEQIAPVKQNKYDFHYGYLMRDWSFVPSQESQFQHQLKTLLDILAQYPLKGRALFPGASSARLPLELNLRFKECEIHALESSYSAVMFYHELLQEDLSIYTIGFKNTKVPEAIASKATLNIPEALKESAKTMHYQWADYQALPYADNSMDWIVSVYFTDVMPFHEFIKETKRVLKPGGYFLHYGPLTWHFKSLEYCYSLEELKALFVEHGFKLEYESEAAYLDDTNPQVFTDLNLAFDLGYVNFKNSILLLKRLK